MTIEGTGFRADNYIPLFATQNMTDIIEDYAFISTNLCDLLKSNSKI